MEPMLCSHFAYKEDSLNLMLVLLTLIISTEAEGVGSEEACSGEGSESPCGTLQGPPELRADLLAVRQMPARPWVWAVGRRQCQRGPWPWGRCLRVPPPQAGPSDEPDRVA